MFLSTRTALRVARNERSAIAALHLQHYDAVSLLNENPHIPHISASRLESPAEASAKAAEWLAELAPHNRVYARANVVIPPAEQFAAKWKSGSTVGVQTRIMSAKDSETFAEATIHNRVLSLSTGPEGRQCDGITLTQQPTMGGPVFDFMIFASRAFHTPAIRATAIPGGDESLFQLDINSPSIDSGEVSEWLRTLGYQGQKQRDKVATALQGLWEVWSANDLLRLEAHIGFTEAGDVLVANPRVLVDDFALYRQPALKALKDPLQLFPLEQMASEAGLFYNKKFDGGNIGCYGYGAGVAMSTMDALVAEGGKPANFLDGGGGATDANVKAAMSVLLADKDVKVIFVNSFGGITKTDLIAKGIVNILREAKSAGETVPKLVVRLRGTGEAEAKEILEGATDLEGVCVIKDMKQAAAEAVALAV